MKQKDGPPQKNITDEELEKEWNWVKERGKYIDEQIFPAPSGEFEEIWKRVRKEP